ncbi:uncharacterized protein B0I36DRAFT_324806 [Microdochium trichocladiopsis]|uniref:Heterokaryon incompatibility domain-containing protein n=1 Tax=Microdochium trichocladiopsis TaxID=1682393 RepID=A0A9P8Y3M2_9PEZI|nr:uncharacterized protein B0I36DRAFT_324806 [Microdochium trichocladiopsis]KAH7028982.1 hypothetical protein B0I36DRAFT_324806 [Microdochium trichocladiopsis]
MMGQIYASASRVIVWLGQSHPVADSAFTYMTALAEARRNAQAPPDERTIKQGLRDVLAILASPWFHRTWVIQEAALGRRVSFSYGNHEIDLDIFEKFVWAIWTVVPFWDIYDDEKDPPVLGLYSVTRTLQIRRRYHQDGAVALEVLLEAAFFVGVTDRRDSVFAFMGICDGETRALMPKPDYRIVVDGHDPEYQDSVDAVFMDLSTSLLCSGRSLDILALAGICRPRPAGFPSWAIYVRYRDDVNAPFACCEPAGWDAGGHLQCKPTLGPSKRLQVTGRVLDEVHHLSEPFDVFEDLSKHKQRLHTVLNSWQRTRCSSRDDHQNQLALDLVLGLDIQDGIAGPEVVTQFKEYLTWLERQTNSIDSKVDDGSGVGTSHDDATNQYHQHFLTQTGGWLVFFTKGGHLGIGTSVIEKGDVVAIIPGCRLPLVLRKTPETGESTVLNMGNAGGSYPGTWVVVGWCYLRDMMRAKGDLGTDIKDVVFILE